MTKDKFLSFYRGTQFETSASVCFDALDKALTEQGINTPNTLTGALATVRTEVGKSFKPIREYASGTQYEGRIDLGNLVPGDGVRFVGRGYIQLTGRDNYHEYSKAIKVDLSLNPDKALEVTNAAQILAAYFRKKGVNTACNQSDWVKVRKLINGGTNGLDTFLSVVKQYLA